MVSRQVYGVSGTTGRAYTDSSVPASGQKLNEQIIKALDLDADSASHSQILEQIRRNKQAAEEAAQN